MPFSLGVDKLRLKVYNYSGVSFHLIVNCDGFVSCKNCTIVAV
jgi:hypothetical protein